MKGSCLLAMSTVVTKGTLWFYPEVKAQIEKVAKTEGITQSALVNVLVSMALSDPQRVKTAADLIKQLDVKWPS